jgi:hypothetical protein
MKRITVSIPPAFGILLLLTLFAVTMKVCNG